MYHFPCIGNRSGMPVFAGFDTVSGFHSNLFLSGFFCVVNFRVVKKQLSDFRSEILAPSPFVSDCFY